LRVSVVDLLEFFEDPAWSASAMPGRFPNRDLEEAAGGDGGDLDLAAS